MARFLPLLLVLALPAVAAEPPKKGTQYAILVAAAEYDKNELKPLPFSQKETDEFRQVLLRTGFDDKNVKFLHDKAERRYLPERKKIADELDLLLGRATADDTVVVLLNGHGVHFTGDTTGYFCPVDAKLTDKSTLLPMDGKGGVFEQLKACKARRKVLLVNACRNDPASDRSLAGSKIKLDDDDKDEVPEGIAALYSCKPGERSYYYDPTDAKSKGRERSLYMHHLIEAWGQGGMTTIEDVFKAVRTNSAADADVLFGRKQNPVVRREYKGDGEWLIGGTGVDSSDDSKARSLRWVISIRTSGGKDYVAQLQALGAKMMVPTDDGKAIFFADLSGDPPKGKAMTEADTKAVSDLPLFTDSTALSRQQIGEALGLGNLSKGFVAYYPKKLAEEMARKEIDYQKRRPEDIGETKFEVVKRDGKSDLVVIGQTPKR